VDPSGLSWEDNMANRIAGIGQEKAWEPEVSDRFIKNSNVKVNDCVTAIKSTKNSVSVLNAAMGDKNDTFQGSVDVGKVFFNKKFSLKDITKLKIGLGAGFNTCTVKCLIDVDVFGHHVKAGVKGHAGGISANVNTNGLKNVDISASLGLGGGFFWNVD